MTINIDFPNEVELALNERARQTGKRTQDVIVEFVKQGLAAESAEEPMSEREQMRALLKEAGMLSEVSPELLKLYVKPRTDEEREAILKELQQISFSPTFSEMILEDRKLR